MPRSSVFDIALRELIAEVAIKVVEAYERERESGMEPSLVTRSSPVSSVY